MMHERIRVCMSVDAFRQVERLVSAVVLADASLVVVRSAEAPSASTESAAAPNGARAAPARVVRLHGGASGGLVTGFSGPAGRQNNILVLGAGRVAASLVGYLGRDPVAQVMSH